MASAIGGAGISSATFTLGRDQAVALIEIDQPLSDDVLQGLARLDGVRDIKALQF